MTDTWFVYNIILYKYYLSHYYIFFFTIQIHFWVVSYMVYCLLFDNRLCVFLLVKNDCWKYFGWWILIFVVIKRFNFINDTKKDLDALSKQTLKLFWHFPVRIRFWSFVLLRNKKTRIAWRHHFWSKILYFGLWLFVSVYTCK